MMNTLLKSFIVLIIFTLPTHAFAIGALAIDSNQGARFGFAYDHASINDAESRALNECGNGCQVVKTFTSGCAAYAADQADGSSIYGWGTGSNPNYAQSNALNYCRNYGGSQCIVRSWGCNSN
jgi:hypothetical protein